ncbi:MAG: hypothetical protein R3C04_03920 [Hyphomonas sp.]
MARKILFAATAAMMFVSGAGAEGWGEKSLNLGLLHWIRDTVCTSGQEVLFVPVSHDVKTWTETYAVVSADDLEASSAHVVTGKQARWLAANGCRVASGPRILQAAIASGGLDL